MIAQLTGTVARRDGGSAVLDVGGVGYLVFLPAPALAALPPDATPVTLVTHLVVRENEWSLYGFLDPVELQAFRLLLAVDGVGPKVALALLSALSVSELARALGASDTRTITKTPGVGPRLAQRLCLELGDRMAAFAFEQRTRETDTGGGVVAENAVREDVIEALVGLGYSRADARRAADRSLSAATDRTDVPSVIRAALSLLTGSAR